MSDSDRLRFEVKPDVPQLALNHTAATAQSAANVREGMIKVRVLDAIVKNRYHNNPGKLAAWTSASHVEKPPKKKKPTPD